MMAARRVVASSAVAASRRVFPGASNGEFDLPAALDRVLARGDGARVWDDEGREYRDFTCGWGSALVGHARPEVVAAVVRQAPLGSNFSYVSEESARLGARIQALSPCVDRLRFVASGTEANLYCERLARAFTGRPTILKFDGAYHGAHELGVTSFHGATHERPAAPTPAAPACAPRGVGDRVLVAPFNDLAAVEGILEDRAEDVAAVFVEPVHRCTPPAPGFLEGLREATRRRNVLLVFDEVVTGFRLALGGAQEHYGVEPDLVAYGKGLGGGYPIGCFGGRADVVDVVDEARHSAGDEPAYVWSASTLGGNPISCAAANAALDIFERPETYPRLRGLGRRFREGLRAVLAARGVDGVVVGDGPIAQIQFADEARKRRVLLGLFERGIFLNPISTKLYLSLAHTDADLAFFCETLDATLVEAQS